MPKKNRTGDLASLGRPWARLSGSGCGPRFIGAPRLLQDIALGVGPKIIQMVRNWSRMFARPHESAQMNPMAVPEPSGPALWPTHVKQS